MTDEFGFPTVLIANDDEEVRVPLVRDLRHQGYIVLVAKDRPAALEIVRVHSRPIHLMLADANCGSRSWAAMLNQYRPKMRVLFVSNGPNEPSEDSVKPETSLEKVRELLNPPHTQARELSANGRPSDEAKARSRVAHAD